MAEQTQVEVEAEAKASSYHTAHALLSAQPATLRNASLFSVLPGKIPPAKNLSVVAAAIKVDAISPEHALAQHTSLRLMSLHYESGCAILLVPSAMPLPMCASRPQSRAPRPTPRSVGKAHARPRTWQVTAAGGDPLPAP